MFWGFDIVAIHFRSDEGYHYAQLVDDILQGGNKEEFSTVNWIDTTVTDTLGEEEGGVLIGVRVKKRSISRRGRKDINFFPRGGL